MSAVKPFSPSREEESLQRTQPVSNPSGADLDNSNLARVIDYVTISGEDYAEYIGEAAPGSDPEDAVWRVKKLVYTGANVTAVRWADGNAEFDNPADDMAGLTYV